MSRKDVLEESALQALLVARTQLTTTQYTAQNNLTMWGLKSTFSNT